MIVKPPRTLGGFANANDIFPTAFHLFKKFEKG